MILQEGVRVESPGPTGHDPTLALDKGLHTTGAPQCPQKGLYLGERMTFSR